jgi:hypothetical protein
MPRGIPPKDRTLYECVEPFSIWRNGIPEVYGAGRMVLAGDPILRTENRTKFIPAADRVEAMSASPGEVRAITIPIPPETQPSTVVPVEPIETVTEEIPDAQVR